MNYDEKLRSTRLAIKEADYILIGAGAGLSEAAGQSLSAIEFQKHFSDFIRKYKFDDLYTSSFHRFGTQEEYWAYWARHIYISRYNVVNSSVYERLRTIVEGKKYFILTTNVDFQGKMIKFPKKNVFMIQGDYGSIQCAHACHEGSYVNDDLIKEMIKHTDECRIPSDLVPKCPRCGGSMSVHIHSDESFVLDEEWNRSFEVFAEYQEWTKDKKVVLIELGVGFSTPDIIRFPFEEFVLENERSILIRVNRDFPDGPANIKDRTISFSEDIIKILEALTVNERRNYV